MALNLILQADAMVCMLRTLSQLKILKRVEVFGEIDVLASGIRRMMSAAVAWVPTGCTCRDLVERSDRAVTVVERLAKSGFIDRSMFRGLNDMCDCFGGYVDEILFGRQVVKEIPRIVREWMSQYKMHDDYREHYICRACNPYRHIAAERVSVQKVFIHHLTNQGVERSQADRYI